jgi:hypothetical protein
MNIIKNFILILVFLLSQESFADQPSFDIKEVPIHYGETPYCEVHIINNESKDLSCMVNGQNKLVSSGDQMVMAYPNQCFNISNANCWFKQENKIKKSHN